MKEINEGAKEAKDNEFYEAFSKVSNKAQSIVKQKSQPSQKLDEDYIDISLQNDQ